MKRHFPNLFCICLLAMTTMFVSCLKVEKGKINFSEDSFEIPQSGGTYQVDCDTDFVFCDAIRISHDNQSWEILEGLQYIFEDGVGEPVEYKNDYIDVKVVKSDNDAPCAISVTLAENTSALPNYYRISITDHIYLGSFNVYQPGK